MDWPAYSPDLNPIEHVWDALGRRIAACLHHPENTHQLKQMLIEEWALLPQEMLHQLVLSMRRRSGNFGETKKHISSSREVHLRWVPLHVNIVGNEIADSLAKDGAAQPIMNSVPLTYSELHSTYINNKQSTVPPAHHWYKAKRPGGSLSLQCSRQNQTILIHFRSGHLLTLTFKDRNKVFPTCVRCSACQASPENIHDCLGLSKQDLHEVSLMVLDFLRVNEIMHLV
ncbi:RNase H domain-containing protein [Trichonephila clavipes]|nr:RNase H domain-containing protein [Trichonephila clavipes]